MNYKTFYNSLPNTHLIKAKYTYLGEYLVNRYGTYELLYPNDEFNEYFIASILEYQNMLQDIELALKTRNSDKYSFDNLGDVDLSTRTGKTTYEGIDSTNYKGYEVLGEFERKNNNNTSNNNEVVENVRSNMLDVLSSLESEKLMLDWYKFEKEFSKLLITITAITF